MSGEAGCLEACCAGICLAITASLQAWCNTKPYSCGGGPKGCCGSCACCEDSFNRDSFDEETQRRRAKSGAHSATSGQANIADGVEPKAGHNNAAVVDTQPGPTSMSVGQPDGPGEQPAPGADGA